MTRRRKPTDPQGETPTDHPDAFPGTPPPPRLVELEDETPDAAPPSSRPPAPVVRLEDGASPVGQPAVWWRLADLDPWGENPRTYSREVVQSLADLIRRHGFNTTIHAHWPTRRIVRGHRRRLACLSLFEADPEYQIPGSPAPGYVPVRFTGGSWAEAERDALADNRAQEDGAWDLDQVGRLVERWTQEGQDLVDIVAATAFQAPEIREILAGLKPRTRKPDEVDAPEVPEPPRKAHSKRGEVYQLGPHRLICGDTTSAQDLAKLLGDERADCVFTDPPYAIYGSSTGLDSSIADDKCVRPFFRAVLASARAGARAFAPVYVCCDWRSWASWWEAAAAVKLSAANMLVWDKGNSGLGSNYGNAHELIGYFLNRPERRKMFKGAAGVRSVLKPNILRVEAEAEPGPDRVDLVDSEALAAALEGPDGEGADLSAFLRYGRVTGRDRVHNAAKPIALIEEVLKHATEPDAVVLDLFGGGGSTLLACARQERRARLVEIEPSWCDVIRHRWTAWALEAGIDPGPGALVLEGGPVQLGAGS